MTRITKAFDARMERIRNGEGEKGFTLIELLVVIIIIGILAAIAIPVFLNQRQAAWKSQVVSDVTNTAVQVEAFATTQNGSYLGADNATTGAKKVQSAGDTINIVNVTATGYQITGTNTNLGTTSAFTYTYLSSTGAGSWGAS